MTTLNSYAPGNGRWTDANGKLTASAQIWLRDLWLRTGGAAGMDHGELIGLDDDDHTQYLTAARGGALFQPLDSDLTAIAALSTTAYGRALLVLSNAAALTALVDTFTTSLKGLVPPPTAVAGKFLADDGTWQTVTTTEAHTLAADESTAADTAPISLTDLSFAFEANATYAFRFVGNVSPATATTGCGFQMLIT